MSAGYLIILLIVGMTAGFLSSMVGIGGGIVIVPALVMIFGMDQTKAQGTSLAMLLPPIGILGVWEYYKEGKVDLKIAAILCVTFILGSFLGGKVVMSLDKDLVKKIFAVFLIVIAAKFLFLDKPAKAAPPADTSTTHNTKP